MRRIFLIVSSLIYVSANVECSAGKYNDQSVCKDCAAGKYQNVSGQSECKNCPGGRWEPTAVAGEHENTYFRSSVNCEEVTASMTWRIENIDNVEECLYAYKGFTDTFDNLPDIDKKVFGSTADLKFDTKLGAAGGIRNHKVDGVYDSCGDCNSDENVPFKFKCQYNHKGCDPWWRGEPWREYWSSKMWNGDSWPTNTWTGESVAPGCYLTDKKYFAHALRGYYKVFFNPTMTKSSCGPGGCLCKRIFIGCSKLCPAGKYNDAVGQTTDTCQECSIQTYSDETAQTTCKDCLTEYVTQKLSGAQSCSTECVPPSIPNGGHLCEMCPAGKVAIDLKCTECPEEKPYDNGYNCFECPDGSVGQSDCQQCPKGRWATMDMQQCLECDGYQDQIGQAICKECPKGRISTGDRLSCVTCPTGKYTDEKNLVECKSCPEGEYHEGYPGQMSSECKTCPSSGADANAPCVDRAFKGKDVYSAADQNQNTIFYCPIKTQNQCSQWCSQQISGIEYWTNPRAGGSAPLDSPPTKYYREVGTAQVFPETPLGTTSPIDYGCVLAHSRCTNNGLVPTPYKVSNFGDRCYTDLDEQQFQVTYQGCPVHCTEVEKSTGVQCIGKDGQSCKTKCFWNPHPASGICSVTEACPSTHPYRQLDRCVKAVDNYDFVCPAHCRSNGLTGSSEKCIKSYNTQRCTFSGCQEKGTVISGYEKCEPGAESYVFGVGFKSTLNAVTHQNVESITTKCGVNEYKNSFLNTVCKKCPVGTFKAADSRPVVGYNDFELCELCPAGKTFGDKVSSTDFVEITSGTCEDVGQVKITDSQMCREAATALGWATSNNEQSFPVGCSMSNAGSNVNTDGTCSQKCACQANTQGCNDCVIQYKVKTEGDCTDEADWTWIENWNECLRSTKDVLKLRHYSQVNAGGQTISACYIRPDDALGMEIFGETTSTPGCSQTQPCICKNLNYNRQVLKDFKFETCRHGNCPKGTFGESGSCIPCPTETYWSSVEVIAVEADLYIASFATENEQELANVQFTQQVMISNCEEFKTRFGPYLDAGEENDRNYIFDACKMGTIGLPPACDISIPNELGPTAIKMAWAQKTCNIGRKLYDERQKSGTVARKYVGVCLACSVGRNQPATGQSNCVVD